MARYRFHNFIFGAHAGELNGWSYFFANLLGLGSFMLKASIGVTIMMWIRWTLPRLRIDQVITTCWKYCTPIAAVMFVGVMTWQLWGWPSGGDILPVKFGDQRRWPVDVRETWRTQQAIQPQQAAPPKAETPKTEPPKAEADSNKLAGSRT